MPDDEDAYGRVTARYYDEAYARLRDASGDTDFYLGLARESGGPVLELGCGTGRTLLPIARAGISCTGLDRSAHMLAALRAKAPPANLRLVQASIRSFDLGSARFALVTAPFRVFQHLATLQDQLACLATVRRHLAPGGTFAFDCFRPRLSRLAALVEPEAEDARWPEGNDEIVRSASVTRSHATQTMEVTLHYDRLRSGEHVARETTRFAMRYFFRYELEHLLQRAGFTRLRLFGDFAGAEFGEESPEMVWLARC